MTILFDQATGKLHAAPMEEEWMARLQPFEPFADQGELKQIVDFIRHEWYGMWDADQLLVQFDKLAAASQLDAVIELGSGLPLTSLRR